MKKSLKNRLTLNRETLRALDAEALSAAEGGAATGGGDEFFTRRLYHSRLDPDLPHAVWPVVLLRRVTAPH